MHKPVHLGVDVPELPMQEAEKAAMMVAAHMEVVELSSTEVEPYELMEQGLFAASQMEDDRKYGMICRTAAEDRASNMRRKFDLSAASVLPIGQLWGLGLLPGLGAWAWCLAALYSPRPLERLRIDTPDKVSTVLITGCRESGAHPVRCGSVEG